MVAEMTRAFRSVLMLCAGGLALATSGCFHPLNLQELTLVTHSYRLPITICHVSPTGELQPLIVSMEPRVGHLLLRRFFPWGPLVVLDSNGHEVAHYPNTKAISRAEEAHRHIVFTPRGVFTLGPSRGGCRGLRATLRELETRTPQLPANSRN